MQPPASRGWGGGPSTGPPRARVFLRQLSPGRALGQGSDWGSPVGSSSLGRCGWTHSDPCMPALHDTPRLHADGLSGFLRRHLAGFWLWADSGGKQLPLVLAY